MTWLPFLGREKVLYTPFARESDDGSRGNALLRAASPFLQRRSPARSGKAPPAGGPAHRQIAVIPKGTTHEFWKSVHAGAMKASQRARGRHRLEGPRARGRPRRTGRRGGELHREARRRHRARSARRHGARPTRKGGRERRRSRSSSSTRTSSGTDRVSFVATNNDQAGAAAARHLGKAPRRQGQRPRASLPGGIGEHHGSREGLSRDVCKGVPRRRRSSPTINTAAPRRRAPTRRPRACWCKLTDIDGVFCPNESTTFGMLRALRRRETRRQGAVRRLRRQREARRSARQRRDRRPRRAGSVRHGRARRSPRSWRTSTASRSTRASTPA